ncbi:hypothetical protein Dimus_030664 [Dionaea muscipula]
MAEEESPSVSLKVTVRDVSSSDCRQSPETRLNSSANSCPEVENSSLETLGNMEMEHDSTKTLERSPQATLDASDALFSSDVRQSLEAEMNFSRGGPSSDAENLGSETLEGYPHFDLDLPGYLASSDDSAGEVVSLNDLSGKMKTKVPPSHGLEKFLDDEMLEADEIQWEIQPKIPDLEASSPPEKTDVDERGSLQEMEVGESDASKTLEIPSLQRSGSESPDSGCDIMLPASCHPSKLDADECEVDGFGASSTLTKDGGSSSDHDMLNCDESSSHGYSRSWQPRINSTPPPCDQSLHDETCDEDPYFRHSYRPSKTWRSSSGRLGFHKREPEPRVSWPGYGLQEPAKPEHGVPKPAKPGHGSFLEPAKPALVGAGLQNLGQTCFMNAILQCFTHTVAFVQGLFSSNMLECSKRGYYDRFCVLCSLRDHIKAALEYPDGVIQPYHLVDNLNNISSVFGRYQQEDAHEYLQCLSNKLDSCWSNHPKNAKDAQEEKSESLVKQTFGGRLVSQLRCCKCGHISDTYEPTIDLSLEIDDADSLQSALESFTKVEKLEDSGSKFTCEGCKEQVSVEKQLKLAEAPSVATFHLKRFKTNGVSVEKIDKTVCYPLELDLEPYTVAVETGKTDLKYELYAYVVHMGRSPSSGHYLCVIRSGPDNWFQFDDSQVRRIQEVEALSEDAYILFYAKKGTPWPCSLIETFKKGSGRDSFSTSPTSVLSSMNGTNIASLSLLDPDIRDTCDSGDHNDRSLVPSCIGPKYDEVLSEARIDGAHDSMGKGDYFEASNIRQQEKTLFNLNSESTSTPFCVEKSYCDAVVNDVGTLPATGEETCCKIKEKRPPSLVEEKTRLHGNNVDCHSSPLEGKTRASDMIHKVGHLSPVEKRSGEIDKVGNDVSPTSVMRASSPYLMSEEPPAENFIILKNHLKKETQVPVKMPVDRSKLDMQRREAIRCTSGMNSHRRFILRDAIMQPLQHSSSSKRKRNAANAISTTIIRPVKYLLRPSHPPVI